MRILHTIIFVFITFFATAQNYSWEVGGGLGTSNYFGDIGGVEFDGKKGPADFMLNTTRFSMGMFARRSIDYRFFANFQLTYSNIIGDDKLSPNSGRLERNLNFENNLIEAIGMIEFHPLIINDLGGKRRFIADLHLHVSTGLGVLYSEPTGNFNGTNVKLRPLSTEGLDKKYSALQMVVPLAAGVFVSFKGRYSGYRVHRVGFSINYRVTFTDYLDDISSVYPELADFNGDQAAIDASYRGVQEDPSNPTYPEGSIRGNPNANDGYLTTMFYYSKRISSGRKKHKLPRRQEFYGKTRRSRHK